MARKAWDWSEPVTLHDGTVHYRETCDCARCVGDRKIRANVLHNKLIDDLCWELGTGRWAQ